MYHTNNTSDVTPYITSVSALFPTWFKDCHRSLRRQDRLKRGREGTATLTDVWLMYVNQGGRCAQTLLPMTWSTDDNLSPYRVSMDRLDNSLPHDIDNLQLVIRCYNTSKAGRTDHDVPERVLTQFREQFRIRPLDEYLLGGVQ